MNSNRNRRYSVDEVDASPTNLRIWLCAFAIFLLTNPFAFILNGTDPSIGAVKDFATLRSAEASQWPLYAVRLLAMGIAFIFASRERRSISRSVFFLWPLALYFLWAMASLSWTDSVNTTLNALISFGMLIATSYFITVQFKPAYLAKATIYSGVLMAIFSIIFAILLPHYGVHSADDASQSVHAGSWRGVYAHKNHLGQMSAIYAVGILMAGRTLLPAWQKIGFFGLMMMLVLLSRSASAIAIILIAPCIVWVAIGLNIKQRLLAFFFLMIVAVGGYITISALLEALGRDLTFTGRTTIWAIAIEALSLRPLSGYGFLSTTYGDFTYDVQSVMGVTDPHSSYFDILLGLGFTGLALFVVPVFYALKAGRQLYVAGGGERQCALVLCGMMVAWLLAGLTEANSRPFVAMFAIGIFSTMVMVKRAPRRIPRLRHGRRKIRGGARFLRNPADVSGANDMIGRESPGQI